MQRGWRGARHLPGGKEEIVYQEKGKREERIKVTSKSTWEDRRQLNNGRRRVVVMDLYTIPTCTARSITALKLRQQWSVYIDLDQDKTRV